MKNRWNLLKNRLHWNLLKNRLHWNFFKNGLHWNLLNKGVTDHSKSSSNPSQGFLFLQSFLSSCRVVDFIFNLIWWLLSLLSTKSTNWTTFFSSFNLMNSDLTETLPRTSPPKMAQPLLGLNCLSLDLKQRRYSHWSLMKNRWNLLKNRLHWNFFKNGLHWNLLNKGVTDHSKSSSNPSQGFLFLQSFLSSCQFHIWFDGYCRCCPPNRRTGQLFSPLSIWWIRTWPKH